MEKRPKKSIDFWTDLEGKMGPENGGKIEPGGQM